MKPAVQEHLNEDPAVMQDPLLHGLLSHGLISVSQFGPVLRGGHSQEYPSAVSRQVPPPSHGSVVQMLSSQRVPVISNIIINTSKKNFHSHMQGISCCQGLDKK